MVPHRRTRSGYYLLALTAVLFGAFGRQTYLAVNRVKLKRPLVEAVKRSDTVAVKALLDSGADPDTRDVPGRVFAWSDVWQALWHREKPNSSAPPVLQLAALNGNPDIARMLVSHGADLNAQSDYWPVIMAAARVATLGSNGTSGGYTALMDAALIHRADIVALLLGHGADPNIHPNDEDSPLTVALKTIDLVGHPQAEVNQADITTIVRMLMEHGADPRRGDVVQLAIDSDWSSVRLLVEKGADANSISDDRSRRTVLIEAAVLSDGDTIQALVAHGANVNSTDRDGRTALMELCGRYNDGDFQVGSARQLLDRGANPNAQDKDGLTALMQAAGVGKKGPFASAGDIEAVKLLLERGASLDLKDKSGRTVLQKLPVPNPNDEYGMQVEHLLQSAAALH